jgi:hypothetical protein
MRPSIMWLMIALVFVSMFVGVFSIYITKLGAEYGLPSSSNTSLESYNKMALVNDNMQDIKEETTNIKEKSGVLDVIGSFFSNAYKILITAPQSIDLVDEMADSAVEDANLGESGSLIKTALISILIIFIFVGLVLAILLKTDRI